MENLGYTNSLIILPFDHRSSFIKQLLHIESSNLSEQEISQVKELKQIIYEAFKKATSESVPKEEGAILVDEQFGKEILDDAKKNGYTTILTTEKSGQDIFDFEYGEEFATHLETIHPTFAKALVRCNPENKETNQQQLPRLKQLSDYCHGHGFKFLIEPLIPPIQAQLESINSDKKRFDREIRPQLTLAMIDEFQKYEVEPDVWKLEGMEETSQYAKVVEQARKEGRENVGVVILGRAADDTQVGKWVRAGAPVSGVIGFAIGRTIFWEALTQYLSNTIQLEEAVDIISKKYQNYYKIFKEYKNL